MYPGRTKEQKAAFADALTEAENHIIKTTREHIIITYDERAPENWFIAGKPM